MGLAGLAGHHWLRGACAQELNVWSPLCPLWLACLPYPQRFPGLGITSPNTVLLLGGPGLPGTVSPQEQAAGLDFVGEMLEPLHALEKGG